MPRSRIGLCDSVAYVQGVMNASEGTQYWKGKDAEEWEQLLLISRIVFVKEHLLALGISIEQYHTSNSASRKECRRELAHIFRERFFTESMDGNWRQRAVGQSGNWIQIDGMAEWHMKHTLLAVERQAGWNPQLVDLNQPKADTLLRSPGAGSSMAVKAYDPVRDV